MDPSAQEKRALQSWKEIAAFLKVTVRTVQRWEKTAGLPVYRQGATAKAHVFAYCDDLEAWLESGGAQEAIKETEGDSPPKVSSKLRLWLALAALAVVIAGAHIVKWGFWRGAAIPSTWAVEGPLLKVFDTNERLCWQKRLPPFDPLLEAGITDKVRILDIDGDGRVEILVNLAPQNIVQEGGLIFCFEEDGKLRWRASHGRAKTFGERSFDSIYVGRFTLATTAADGKHFLITIAMHHLWYPATVQLRDPMTGNVVEEYWHPGAIYGSVLWDIDRDGNEELVFSALNNPGRGLGHMAMGALKIPFSKAQPKPVSQESPFRPLTGGGEFRYALFPLPDVNDAAGVLPIPSRMTRIDDDRIVVIMTVPDSGGIIYTLDRHLDVTECRFSDNFEALHNRLSRNGLLNHELTDKEMVALGKVLPFPEAPDGNNPALKELWE